MTTSRIYSSQSKKNQDPTDIDWRKLRDDAEGADNFGDDDIYKTIEQQVIEEFERINRVHDEGLERLRGSLDLRCKNGLPACPRIVPTVPQKGEPFLLGEKQEPSKQSAKNVVDGFDNDYEELEPEDDAKIAAEIAAVFNSERTLVLSPGSPCASASRTTIPPESRRLGNSNASCS